MNPPELDEAVVELGRRLRDQDVTAVILFGSVARGEARAGSDIDLLVVPRSPRGEQRVLRAIQDVEDRRSVRISPVISRFPDLKDLERQFLESVLRQGRVLAGKMPDVSLESLDMEPVRLLSLDLSSLTQAKKMRLERELFGYQTQRRKGRRVYESRSSGLLGAWGGRRLGRHLIIVPEAALAALESLLRERGARRILLPVWIQRS